MKINNMTTISKSITLKIFRATNQICQLKSNSGYMYKQKAVVSATQHAGFMVLYIFSLFSQQSQHGNDYLWQITETKVLLCFHPPGLARTSQSLAHVGVQDLMLSPSTGSPLFAIHIHTHFTWCDQPGPAPPLTHGQPQNFTEVLLICLKIQRIYFFDFISIIYNAPLFLHPLKLPLMLLQKRLIRTESHLIPQAN